MSFAISGNGLPLASIIPARNEEAVETAAVSPNLAAPAGGSHRPDDPTDPDRNVAAEAVALESLPPLGIPFNRTATALQAQGPGSENQTEFRQNSQTAATLTRRAVAGYSAEDFPQAGSHFSRSA